MSGPPRRATTILETPRLVLRELVADDLDFVATMMADPDVSRYYERTFARADAEQWLERQLSRYARHGHGLWLALERETGTPVGQVGLAIQEVEGVRRAELGWLLHRAHWGRGYATEAGAACRDAGFTRWRYREIISLLRAENTPSRRVAERIGMKAEERHVAFHGFEHIVYSVRPAPSARAPRPTRG